MALIYELRTSFNINRIHQSEKQANEIRFSDRSQALIEDGQHAISCHMTKAQEIIPCPNSGLYKWHSRRTLLHQHKELYDERHINNSILQ